MVIHNNSFRDNNLPLDAIKKDNKMSLDSSSIHLPWEWVSEPCDDNSHFQGTSSLPLVLKYVPNNGQKEK